MPKKPTLLSVTPTAKSRLFEIETVHLRFSNGEERHYERLKSRVPEAVMVVAIDHHELILVREYGVGIEAYTLGFPKGLIDPGETPEHAAHRELQEEAGLGAGRVRHPHHFHHEPRLQQHENACGLGRRPVSLDITRRRTRALRGRPLAH